MKDIKVPFFSNTPDNTHCFQACVKMVLKYFYPKEDYSVEELDKISHKIEGKWTWPNATMVWLQAKGMEVVDVEQFDNPRFVAEGESYLIAEYGEEVARVQIENSDIEKERIIAKELLDKVKVKMTEPKLEDIQKYLNNGYLVIVNVNSEVLGGGEGYAGHFLVVKGFNNTSLIVHDPGLPGVKNRVVDKELFEKAWAYPNSRAKNIIAIRKVI